ncbi:MAG: hypothetical protein ACYS8W_05465 [Planctomycetota bacterium]|jgi:hypothetical protein
MPIIATNIATETYEKIKVLVEQRKYTNIEQFVEIALLNQVALEQGSSPEDILRTGKNSVTHDKKAHGEKKKARSKDKRKRKRGRKAATRKSQKKTPVPSDEIEQAIARLQLPSTDIQTPDTFDAFPRPDTEHLWGQVNRLLPIKIACRWITVHASDKNEWPRFEEFSDSLSEDVATIGSALEEVDIAQGRKRDQQLATGLPRRGNIASRDRFISQYIARVTRRGDIYPGAICQYAFAVFDADRLALTDKGIKLARLQNPILDGDLTTSDAALLAEEKVFYINQVVDFVPGELNDFRLVLSAIASGKTEPSRLSDSIKDNFSEEWSPGMYKTHISGVIARMAEMGLIERNWEGRFVQYSASPEGSEVLNAESTQEE